MQIRIEQKWALEELSVALRELKAVGLSLVLPSGELWINGPDSSIYLEELSPEAIGKALRRAEQDEDPIPEDAEDC